MSKCPTCGQPVAPTEITDPNKLLAILNTRGDGHHRNVYKSQGGTWSITYHGGRVSPAAVQALLNRGLIRRTYSTCDDCFTTDRTIDCEATIEARKHNKRAALIYADPVSSSQDVPTDNSENRRNPTPLGGET